MNFKTKKILAGESVAKIEHEFIAPKIIDRFLTKRMTDSIESKYWKKVRKYLQLRKSSGSEYFQSLPQKILSSKVVWKKNPAAVKEILMEPSFSASLSFQSFSKNLKKILENSFLSQGIWKLLEDIDSIEQHKHLKNFLVKKEHIHILVSQIEVSTIEISNVYQKELVMRYIDHSSSMNVFNDIQNLCLHSDIDVSNYALKIIAKNCNEINIYLALLESGLPHVMDVAKKYFKSIKKHHDDYVSIVLAICDSPIHEAQMVGFDLLRKSIHYFPKAKMLKNLSESKNIYIQEWVARALSSKISNDTDVYDFEIEILKSRNEKRELKELVKEIVEIKIAENLRPDLGKRYESVLIGLVHGLIGPDKEWALKNLTQLKKNNYSIEGLRLLTPIKS